MSRLLVCVFALLPAVVLGQAQCSEIKAAYKTSVCCGDTAAKKTNFTLGTYAPAAKLLCTNAEVQAPRDLSTGATGKRASKAATLNDAQAHKLPQTNIHFHLGAEHKSDAYNDGTASAAFDAAASRRASGAIRPGWMCPSTGMTAAQLAPYNFLYCTGDMAVGKTYEVHYVHSSAGSGSDESPELSDGLGSAAGGRGIANPMIAVEAQIYQLVNDAAYDMDDLAHGWDKYNHSATNTVMYPGSTTGTSYDNTYCSPYTITWHVDKRCTKVSAKSFDLMCKHMKEAYNQVSDLAPHNSRKILSPDWVVPASEVVGLA